MKPRILLVNPPIYDFSAYDFWLKPYGMLRVAGFLRGRAEFCLVDFLDRLDGRVPPGNYRSDSSGRGAFYSEPIKKPEVFADIPREFHRYGLPRETLQCVLRAQRPFDYALVQTGMTYWCLGVREIVAEMRRLSPATKIVLGGVYATLCPAHARSLDVDLVVEGSDLGPLWRFLGMAPDEDQLPLWGLYSRLQTGVLKLADGCPFRCTYCSVPQVEPLFRPRPPAHSLAELSFLHQLGVQHVAFYDDALLYRPDKILAPFLRAALQRGIRVQFHTPNAMNARFIDRDMARLLVAAGFKNIYLGFESSAYAWQKKTGGKVYSQELERAVENLLAAGADRRQIHTYLIAGHPHDEEQGVEDSMRFAHGLGIKVMLSEFSPIPGTPDGESCRRWIDMDEPLRHNKTAFAVLRLGAREINRLKTLAGRLNRVLWEDGRAADSANRLRPAGSGLA
jgi:tRNA A37 methylthiotransferase MiaB